MTQADQEDSARETLTNPPRNTRSQHGRHADIWKRAGELLRTSIGVWIGAAAVNAVTLLTQNTRGLVMSLPVAAATLVVASLAAWAAGRLEIGRGGLAIKRGDISLRRVAAVGLAVLLASLATAVVVGLATTIISVVEAAGNSRAG